MDPLCQPLHRAHARLPEQMPAQVGGDVDARVPELPTHVLDVRTAEQK